MNAAIDYIRSIGHKTWCHAINENECQCGYHEACRLIEINNPTNRVLETDTIDGAIRKLDRRVHKLEQPTEVKYNVNIMHGIAGSPRMHPGDPFFVPAQRPAEPFSEPIATCYMADKIKVKVWKGSVYVYDNETFLGALLR